MKIINFQEYSRSWGSQY